MSKWWKNYTNFFGSKKTEKILRKNLKLVRDSLVNTFEIARHLKAAIVDIAKGLKGKGGKGGGLLGGLGGMFGMIGGITGIIGGLGGPHCRTAAAHALHNGITQILSSSRAFHGEIVGFGILVQLKLEEIIMGNQLAKQSLEQLIPFYLQLSLPISIEELGIKSISLNELKTTCDFACKPESEIHHLPFPVNSEVLLEAILKTNRETILISSSSKNKL